MKKKFLSWFFNDPVKSLVYFSVLSFHIIFIFYSYSPLKKFKDTKNHKLIVKTSTARSQAVPISTITPKKEVSLPKTKVSKPKTEKIKQEDSLIKSPPLVKSTPSLPKKIVPEKSKNPISSSPKSIPKGSQTSPSKVKEKKMVKKATTNLVEEELLVKLDQHLSKIEEKKPSISSKASLTIPSEIEINTPLEKHKSASALSTFDINNYAQKLSLFFKEQLILPEHGEVKIEILISSLGIVEKCLVIKAESEKNKRYLQEQLLSLHLPDLQQTQRSTEPVTFILTFCNEF